MLVKYKRLDAKGRFVPLVKAHQHLNGNYEMRGHIEKLGREWFVSVRHLTTQGWYSCDPWYLTPIDDEAKGEWVRWKLVKELKLKPYTLEKENV